MSRRPPLVFLLAACSLNAHGQACSPQLVERAQASVEHINTWRDLDEARRRYSPCDDGSISEGFSEAVARLLVDHWTALDEFSALARKDDGLRAFVLRHVNATLDTDDLQRIEKLAREECPVTQKWTCRALHHAASQAQR